MIRHLPVLTFLLVSAFVSFPAFSQAVSPLSGAWRGELSLGQQKLPIVLNFSRSDDGKTQCTLDSPAQGAKGIPTTVTYCSTDSVALECTSIAASYSGRISSGKITGTFSQLGYRFPLVLSPEESLTVRRPQTPCPPFPYDVIDTTFTAPDGAVMSATLTMPGNVSDPKVPAVVMVTGSGPQNRDEEIFEHRPFAVIADFLARNGVASLRYDDRGTGKSAGDFSKATTFTFKDDAAAGVRFLRSVAGVGSVGVLGHSEGGTISFMLAAEEVPDFIISIAGMAEPGIETLVKQNATSLAGSGLSKEEQDNALSLVRLLFREMADQHRRGLSSPVDIDSLARSAGLTVNPLVVSSLKQSNAMRSPWFDTFLLLDPADYLRKIKCPVLALYGSKDSQVDAESNAAVINRYAPKAETKILPGLNHLMQHSPTGSPTEYGEIRETISPEVLQDILQFII